MSNLPQWIQWRGPTAPPPQMRPVDPATLTLMREHALNVYALAELTGVPTLYRWIKAIWERRPIHDVEREYFEPLYRQLQQLAAPSLLRLETPQLRGIVPIDYIVEGKRAPPVQTPQIDPEYVRKMLQEVGAPTSPEDVAAQVAGRSVVLSLMALPGLAGLTKEAAKQLAKVAAAGFGVGGTGAAVTRVVQGFPEEAPKAFVEVGLASTVVADIASALRSLAASVSAPQLRAATQQVLRRQQQAGSPWRDPEGEAFIKEVEDALLRLKRGDTSKYDVLLRRFEEWQRKIEEFNKLYEAKQRGQLTAEDEARYTKLLREVSEIRDKYDLLRRYIEAAREVGLEAGARRAELERRTIEDLARAAREMPPGPPPRDVTEWLQRLDYDLLQKLAKDPQRLAKYARRFGVDEQTLAERVALMLRERAWENMANLPNSELKKILMDETLLKKYASEFGMSEDALRARLEELLQRRMGVKPPETQPIPERPPIEPIRRPETQPKPPGPPETEVQGGKGQVLIVRAEEEVRPAVRRLEELPDVQARLRTLLRSRLREESPEVGRVRSAEGEMAARRRGASDEQTPRARDREESPAKTREEQPVKTRNKEEQLTKTQTSEETAVKTAADRVVLDNETLRTIIPALPAYVFTMPALTVLNMISRVVGAPIVLAPSIPRPLPRESFGAWLDRVFAGTGFTWRSLAAQKETFVFA